MIIEEALPTFMSLINQSLFTGSMDGVKFSVIDPLLKKCGLDSDDKKIIDLLTTLFSLAS